MPSQGNWESWSLSHEPHMCYLLQLFVCLERHLCPSPQRRVLDTCVDVLDPEACIFALAETIAIFQIHCFLFQINPGVDLGFEGLEAYTN